MALELTVIDSFTAVRFSGNPAAIAFVEEFPPEEEMRGIAAEMNLAETAFVAPRGDGEFDLRWFTPTVEVDLCGHATLAAAYLLEGESAFHTRSGVLRCTNRGDGWVEMDFPSDPPRAVDRMAELPFRATWLGMGRAFLLAELDRASDVRGLEPDFSALAGLGSPIIVTSAGDRSGIDCVSRMFAPTYGIPEDPVTGSAHCTLAPYWAERTGRRSLVGEQASRRGGIVAMELVRDRVTLSGQAVVVSRVSFA
jgi:predicted PhzF superfamily epimerase YddE/YHI9